MSGFTTATSIIVIVAQLKSLLGLHFKSLGFIDNVRQLIYHAVSIRLGDTALGISCLIALMFLKVSYLFIYHILNEIYNYLEINNFKLNIT